VNPFAFLKKSRDQGPGSFDLAVGLLACLVVAVAAFSAGRFSAPLKVETRDVVKTVYQDRIVEKRVEVAGATKVETRVIYRDVIRKPDGTIVDHTVTKTGDSETANSASADTKTEAVNAASEQTHTQTVTLRPQWAVTLQVGASLPKPWLQLYGPLVIGAEVDYRLVGGLSVGVWINTFGAAGGAFKWEF
jgi:hypothetical protein